MSGNFFCKPSGLLFECLADQNPFSLRWIITLCVIETHRDHPPNWLAQHIGLLVVPVSTDGRTIDKDQGERWARKPKKILRLSALSAAVPEGQRPRRPSTFLMRSQMVIAQKK
jgi:hypothetical protein